MVSDKNWKYYMSPGRPTSLVATLMTYLLVVPGVASITVLVVLGAPVSLSENVAAALLTVGFGYVVGAVPALITGAVAVAIAATPLWLRLLLPAVVAALLARFFIGLVLHPGGGSADPDVLLALSAGGALGALIAGAIVEWRAIAARSQRT